MRLFLRSHGDRYAIRSITLICYNSVCKDMNYFLHNQEKPLFVSPGVISITPNRNLDSPKVIFVTLGVSFLFDFSLNPVSVADDAKVKKNRDRRFYPHILTSLPSTLDRQRDWGM